MEKLRACSDISVSVMKELSRFHASEFLLDTLFITKDGQVWAHSIVLSAVSPFLKSLFNSVQDMVDDVFSVHLPDVESGHLHILLHLLYTGSTFIFRPELDSVKTLTGLLKLISISVTMAKQEWKSRHEIGKTSVNVLENGELFSNKNQLSDNIHDEAFNSDNIKIEREKNKNSHQPSTSEGSNIQSMTYSFFNHVVKPCQNYASEIQLIKNSSSDLDKFTMRELANKELNPLFEESAVNDSNMTNMREDKSSYERNSDTELSSVNNTDATTDNIESEMEEVDTVKEIQVYVSGNGEVTSLQVLRDEEDLMECVDQDLTKEYQGLDRLATESNLCRAANGEDNLEGTPGELEFAVTQIASLNPDAPFVIGNEGVIGLISVTEAFENTQKPDFNDVSNPVVEGTETETLIRKCPLCLKSVLGLHALGRHMKTAHPKLFGPYECPVSHCKRAHEDGTKVLSHMTQQHSKQASNITGGKPAQHSVSNSEIKCTICNIAVSSEEILNKHCLRFHGFSWHDPLQSDKQVYLCTEKDCNQRFRTCRSFADHVKQVHKQKPWLCDECGKRFDIKQNYQNHTLLHGPKRQFVCDLCSKSYATPRLLYSHRALHLGRRFPCDQCSFVGRSNANLRGHKISVHGERKFSCNTCDKKFAIGTNLREHMKIHTGETPFHCEICDMSYKRKHHLACHIRSKAHLEMMQNCAKLGISIPPELDPDNPTPSSANMPVEETVLGAGPNFETHIAEMDEDDERVLIFQPCEEIEPYIIQESEEVVVI